MIFTFYSFKGGVGRSMALVNVGEVLCQAGLRVLLVDFDLEAPSLEAYFPDDNRIILDSPGVLDLVHSYKLSIMSPGPIHQAGDSELPFKEIQSAVVNVRQDAGGGSIGLISVGQRASDRMGQYVNAVHALDWRDFYDNWEGELYFRWLRQQLSAHADVTLVDCPAGINDVGGICCGQIADAVVLLCALNVQQMSGCEMMAKRLLDPKLMDVRGIPLEVIVIPSKIENAEVSMLYDFWKRFADRFARYLPEGLSADDVWRAAIPFTPYYSFGNHIAVREESSRPSGMAAAYRQVTSLLSRLAPRDSSLFAVQDKLS